MSTVCIIGGSVLGFGTAIALADRGHQVEILERSTDQLPSTVDEAAEAKRPTVPQGVHSHAFGSLGCNLLRDRAPDVYQELLHSGCTEVNLADYTPPTLPEFTRKPEDDDLRMVISRRSTFELALRKRALTRPNIKLSTGKTVRGLVADGQRVTGVRLADGETKTADLVIDTTGRKSAAESWLAAAGLPVPNLISESCKITYYTRFYKLTAANPPGPLNRGFGSGGLWDHYTAVLFLGDNKTFSISFGILPEDTALKSLRTEEAFTAAVQATPLLAGWVAPGNSEPISPVYAMGSLDNSLKLPSPEQPPVEGFYGIGDSVCTTNPSYGRGVSLGLKHAYLLADLLEEHPEVGPKQASEFAERTEKLLRPWWEEAVMNDRGRAALWEATVNGEQPQRPPAGIVNFGMAVAASTKDQEIWRRVANVMMMLKTPDTLYADDEIKQRVGKALAGGPPPQLPGACRSDLVEVVAKASGAEEVSAH
ncbi:FAD-dependent oxidoreductase [Amycolatopsis nigrescens]|uniref:FAD-dependent oxidoreductase n=1 Tax=Amycolatopsis nigrescens TaxID=381445 RepID=UPI00058F528A|nr:FAD-dependent oxidoreductase [Amycolatopsis nigrescens]